MDEEHVAATAPGQLGERDTPASPDLHAVVLGGGIAGMAAACELLDAGCAITLVEKRPFLGGRAFSFTDAQTGSQVDNGQHVFLGCCEHYIRFLQKLGTLGKTHLQSSLSVGVMDSRGKMGYLRASPLPAPFHLLPSFLRYPHLGWRDKLLALYGLFGVILTDRSKPALEEQSFYQWLKGRRQTERAIRNFWDLIVRPTLSDGVEDISASMGLMVFQEGVLKGRHNADIGYARVGLSELMGEAARAYIQQKGGTLLMGRSVQRILCEGRRVAGVELAGEDVVQGDVYVSALPYDVLAKALPEDVIKEGPLKGITALSSSPIVNVHIWYDRRVMEEEFVALVDSPLQWVFNRSRIGDGSVPGTLTGATAGQHVCISLSGAWEHIHEPKEALERTFLEAMAEAFPRAAGARVEKVLVVKEEQATFRSLPGVSAHRPPTETLWQNFFLAGEWTDTGWPSTMEGAVRSGVWAAQAAIDRR